MAYFKKLTVGNIIVVGSNTLKSFPHGNPLPDRTNIILFPGGEKRADCIVVQSLDELFTELKKYPSDKLYVCGGAMFYKTMLEYCDEILVTKVDSDGQAQVFYENLDKRKDFICISESAPIESNGLNIKFTKYKNLNVKSI
jgi:dihydrofolate reductase